MEKKIVCEMEYFPVSGKPVVGRAFFLAQGRRLFCSKSEGKIFIGIDHWPEDERHCLAVELSHGQLESLVSFLSSWVAQEEEKSHLGARRCPLCGEFPLVVLGFDFEGLDKDEVYMVCDHPGKPGHAVSCAIERSVSRSVQEWNDGRIQPLDWATQVRLRKIARELRPVTGRALP